MEVLAPGPHALASLRSTSAAGAAQEAAVLAALQLLHTALDLDEAAPGGHSARRHAAEQMGPTVWRQVPVWESSSRGVSRVVPYVRAALGAGCSCCTLPCAWTRLYQDSLMLCPAQARPCQTFQVLRALEALCWVPRPVRRGTARSSSWSCVRR